MALLASQEPEASADLASYLLLDAGFAEELLSLGRADARTLEQDWVRFSDDAPINAAEREEQKVEEPRRASRLA